MGRDVVFGNQQVAASGKSGRKGGGMNSVSHCDATSLGCKPALGKTYAIITGRNQPRQRGRVWFRVVGLSRP